jgi:hypothetical protein
MCAFLGERGGLLDLAANDIPRDDDEDAGQKRDAPAPRTECSRRHVGREREEDGRRHDLARLHALKGEAPEQAASTKRGMLEDHRAGAGNLSRNREALDQSQYHEQHGSERADLLVGRQETHRHSGRTHEKHAHEQHGLATVGIAPVPEHKGPDRAGDVADAVSRERCHDGDRRVLGRKENLRKHQGRRGRVDEEVIVLQRRSDPTAGCRLLRLALPAGLMIRGVSHFRFPNIVCQADALVLFYPADALVFP